MTDEIRTLVIRLIAGDRQAFEEVVFRFQNYVFSKAYGVIGNVEDAKEITQDVFLMLLQKKGAVRRPEAFLAFLRTSARNKAFDLLRKRKVKTAYIETHSHTCLDDSPPAPEEESIAEERAAHLKQKITEAVSDLPQDQQEVIRLRYERGYSYKEIADYLDCGMNVVRGRLYRAHKSIAGKLGPCVKE